MKKLLSICVAILLIASMSVVPVYAAESTAVKKNSSAEKADSSDTIESTAAEKGSSAEKVDSADTNKKLASSVKALESKYGISIKYPKKKNGEAMITMNNIETLDRAFSTMTPEVVKQVSSYYEKKNGRKIEVEYYFSNSDYSYNGGVLMAAFQPRTSNIFVFLPSQAGRAIISGENPIALVHEMGHAFHLMCMDLYGEQQMRSEWATFNGNQKYNNNGLNEHFSKTVFISSYATTKYEEDFAETFGHLFVRTAAGTGFRTQLTKNSEATGLGRKVKYIEKLLNTYIKNSGQAVENLRRIYNTPTDLAFEGLVFYGETLQYIGYPQPKNILKGILNGLNIDSQKSTWVRALGAWRVIDTNGDMYYIFPGGARAKAVQNQLAA